MQVKFDVHGTKIGLMTNPTIGRGVVEVAIEFRGDELMNSTLQPGEPQRYEDAGPLPRSVTLFLPKGEARAIASAIMGAAAEL